MPDRPTFYIADGYSFVFLGVINIVNYVVLRYFLLLRKDTGYLEFSLGFAFLSSSG